MIILWTVTFLLSLTLSQDEIYKSYLFIKNILLFSVFYLSSEPLENVIWKFNEFPAVIFTHFKQLQCKLPKIFDFYYQLSFMTIELSSIISNFDCISVDLSVALQQFSHSN